MTVPTHTTRQHYSVATDQHSLVENGKGCIRLGVGVVQLSAPESLDLLHRLSTNATLDIPRGHARPTVLTTEKGRIVDRVLLVNSMEKIFLLTGPGRAAVVADWVKKFIITETIEVDDVTDMFSTLFVIGAEANSWIESAFGIPQPAGEGIGLSTMMESVLGLRDPLWPIPAVHLLAPRAEETRLLQQAEGSMIGKQLYDSIRIQCAVPASGTEIIEEVNPLEAGLSGEVSFTKGCYVGQEVIARIDSYGKLQKRLSRFVIEGAVEPPMLPGAPIFLGAVEVGKITSAAPVQGGHDAVALGFLRTGVLAVEFRLPPYKGMQELSCRLFQ